MKAFYYVIYWDGKPVGTIHPNHGGPYQADDPNHIHFWETRERAQAYVSAVLPGIENVEIRTFSFPVPVVEKQEPELMIYRVTEEITITKIHRVMAPNYSAAVARIMTKDTKQGQYYLNLAEEDTQTKFSAMKEG